METTLNAAPQLTRDGEVFILDLGDRENRFNPDRNDAVEQALAEVEAAPGPRALVTIASGKIWSNGLDLDWFQANPERVQETVDQTQRLLAAFLGAGVPTVAAIQGHCFAGGAMLALAHDHLVMREDRGFICLPEADLGLPFTPGMNSLLLNRLPRRTVHEVMVTGRRYGGAEAAEAGIVDQAVSEGSLFESALEYARAQAGKSPDALRAIKGRMYAETIRLLNESHPVGA
ncbi:MAG: enoyl-CoA hydratase/isomerase family protein [Solirubrobacterales bacterium]|nr:enoyl-CoA hydratase/isomerase family protein [Solirubrobacterales bacterium]